MLAVRPQSTTAGEAKDGHGAQQQQLDNVDVQVHLDDEGAVEEVQENDDRNAAPPLDPGEEMAAEDLAPLVHALCETLVALASTALRPWTWRWLLSFELLLSSAVATLFAALLIDMTTWGHLPTKIWSINEDAEAGTAYYVRDQDLYSVAMSTCGASMPCIIGYIICLHHFMGATRLRNFLFRAETLRLVLGFVPIAVMTRPEVWEGMGYAAGVSIIGFFAHFAVGIIASYSSCTAGDLPWAFFRSRVTVAGWFWVLFYMLVTCTHLQKIGATALKPHEVLLASFAWRALSFVACSTLYLASLDFHLATRLPFKLAAKMGLLGVVCYLRTVAHLWRICSSDHDGPIAFTVGIVTWTVTHVVMLCTLHCRQELVFALQQRVWGWWEQEQDRTAEALARRRRALFRRNPAVAEYTAVFIACLMVVEVVAVISAPLLALMLEPSRLVMALGYSAGGASLNATFLWASTLGKLAGLLGMHALCWTVLQDSGWTVVPLDRTWFQAARAGPEMDSTNHDMVIVQLTVVAAVGMGFAPMVFQRFPPWQCDADPCACTLPLLDAFEVWCIKTGRRQSQSLFVGEGGEIIASSNIAGSKLHFDNTSTAAHHHGGGT